MSTDNVKVEKALKHGDGTFLGDVIYDATSERESAPSVAKEKVTYASIGWYKESRKPAALKSGSGEEGEE